MPRVSDSKRAPERASASSSSRRPRDSEARAPRDPDEEDAAPRVRIGPTARRGRLVVRVSARELQMAQDLADREGLTVSDLVRQLLRKERQR